VGRTAFALYTGPARAADRAAARSVDAFLTQSPFTAGLIEKAYGRHADVLPPPVDARLFTPAEGPPQDYFLFVGRLVEAYKRPSLVVEAFRRMPDQRLLIAGDGPALQSLRRQASDNVEFLGALEDSELVAVMQACRAALFPSIDDYGLVPLEVNACGRPVLALPAGGSLHTVVEGVTGEFLERQSTEAIVQAVRAFDEARYDSEIIRQHAMRWSTDSFREQLRAAALRVVEGVRENATLDDAGAAEGR
jgi:glycosyltransferase involved in cell wall biosynthesis